MLLQHHNDQRKVNNVSIVLLKRLFIPEKKKHTLRFQVVIFFYSLD